MAKIVLDAGHGGKDGGAQGNGLSEKELVLTLAKKTKDLLEEYQDATVLMTRESDVYKSLDERTNWANKQGADVFISIHINAHDSTANGFESYIYNGTLSEGTKSLQNVLHQEIMANCSSFFDDRGQKRANFHVLRETKMGMEAVLTENGFISSKSDAKHLKDPNQLNKIAKGHAVGIAKYLGLKKKAEPAPAESNSLWKVQCGAFSNKENAERLAERLEADGYPTYIVEEKR